MMEGLIETTGAETRHAAGFRFHAHHLHISPHYLQFARCPAQSTGPAQGERAPLGDALGSIAPGPAGRNRYGHVRPLSMPSSLSQFRCIRSSPRQSQSTIIPSPTTRRSPPSARICCMKRYGFRSTFDRKGEDLLSSILRCEYKGAVHASVLSGCDFGQWCLANRAQQAEPTSRVSGNPQNMTPLAAAVAPASVSNAAMPSRL